MGSGPFNYEVLCCNSTAVADCPIGTREVFLIPGCLHYFASATSETILRIFVVSVFMVVALAGERR